MRTIKDTILCTITAVALLAFFASFMALAEGNWQALLAATVSLGWIYLFCKVNKKVLSC